ncbi:hypothetical protein E2C01_019290 [Portunus trituberculatus]|uniref:Uncharacterized protein n=1 Tax=Portunus trituberculatus TaxID=210409 RepID=A0A5B7DYM7_PORTR|nr:hypothetical protein [Portunus trituberculatus]
MNIFMGEIVLKTRLVVSIHVFKSIFMVLMIDWQDFWFIKGRNCL